MTELFRQRFKSPCGEISIIFDECETLLHLDFPDQGDRQDQMIKRRFGTVEVTDRASHLADKIMASFNGDRSDLPCDPGGTDFQRRVWEMLHTIPRGQTWSYKELAQKIGNPKAVRAVARANALNPISLIYPCHRVIGANGSLTGYAGGLTRKKWLLRHEGALPPTE